MSFSRHIPQPATPRPSTHPAAIRSRQRRGYIRAYQKDWVAQRRQEWIDANGPCAECGSKKDLQVDHTDYSEKAMSPTNLWSMAPNNPLRIAELAKCQVLCGDCHEAKTRKELAEMAQIQTIFHRRDGQGKFLPGPLPPRARSYRKTDYWRNA